VIVFLPVLIFEMHQSDIKMNSKRVKFQYVSWYTAY